MSDALFAGLPRFDTGADSPAPRGAGSWLRELDAVAPGGGPVARPVADNTRPAPGRTEPSQIPPASQPADLAKIEASLAALNSKLDKIEREAQVQIVQTISSIAAKLFPELSRHFLAEEIGRHLAVLVPPSAAVIEIRAETELAGKLRERVEGMPSLAHRCTIMPVAGDGQGRVDVSWQSGGLTFDFDGLLKACLSHLTSTQTALKE